MCPFLKWIWDNTKNIKPIPFDESDYTWEVIVSGADDQISTRIGSVHV